MATMHDTVASLLSPPKGILAADEHLGKPWQQVARAGTGPAATPEERYHELLLTTPDLDTYLSGVIVSAGSFSRREFPPADSLIVAGVRLGTGTDLWPDGSPAADGDQTDELRTRLGHLRESGARFAKWRADLDPMGKSRPAGYVNTKFLAQCAASSQEVSLLPVLDVAMPNQRSHSLAVAEAVTANALDSLFVELEARHVDLRTVLLRMNMVQAGEWHDQETTLDEGAQSTAKVLCPSTFPRPWAGSCSCRRGRTTHGRAPTSPPSCRQRRRGPTSPGRSRTRSAGRWWPSSPTPGPGTPQTSTGPSAPSSRTAPAPALR